MLREAEVFTLSGIGVHFDRNMHSSLLPSIMPGIGLQWLLEDKDLLVFLFAQMSGKQSLAGAIGEIVRKADKASVGKALGGKQTHTPESVPQQGQKAVALHEQLLMAIRYLFHEGRLTINKPGAAGWIKDGTAWLVSKATVEAASTHLFSEGIRTVPKNVARVFDILAEHDLVETTQDGKAVWKCKVYDEDRDWHQELTMLKFKVESIWPNQSPADLKGSITPLTAAPSSKPKQTKEKAVKQTPSESPAQSPETSSSDCTDTPDSVSMSVQNENVFDQESPPYPLEDIPVMDQSYFEFTGTPEPQFVPEHPSQQQEPEPVSKPAQEKPKRAARAKPPKSTKTPNQKIGEDFVAWVKAGVADKSIKINDQKAMVHVVNDKILLVSPAIFQRYVRDPTVQVKLAMVGGTKSDERKVQTGFQKLFLHEKTQSGQNVTKCEVRGDRRVSSVSGYLVTDPEVIFGDTPVPSSNPHLKVLS